MFTEKHPETGKNKLTTLSKTIITAVSFIAAIVGAVIKMEDRYLNTAVAKEMYATIEKDAVKTFQMMQRTIDTKQKALEEKLKIQQDNLKRHYKMKELEDLRQHKVLLQHDLEERPNDVRTKELLDRVNRRIQNLEDELFR